MDEMIKRHMSPNKTNTGLVGKKEMLIHEPASIGISNDHLYDIF